MTQTRGRRPCFIGVGNSLLDFGYLPLLGRSVPEAVLGRLAVAGSPTTAHEARHVLCERARHGRLSRRPDDGERYSRV